MKSNIKDYFDFRKSERIGTIILVTMILIALFLPGLLKNIHLRKDDGFDAFKLEVHEFPADSISTQTVTETVTGNSYNTSKNSSRYHPAKFDPNSLDIEGWTRMGFSQKQAEVILKYRNKIGGFASKEDFKDIYIIDNEIYKIFEPFIDIKLITSRLKSEFIPVNLPKKNNYVIELNSADSAELDKIRGIGPVFAKRIIKYREKLGGFSRIRQLEEVYGLDSLSVTEFQDQVFIDSTLITRININTVSLNDLREHPYIGYYIGKAIIDKRIQLGKITSLDQILHVRGISPDIFLKIKPYLTLE